MRGYGIRAKVRYAVSLFCIHTFLAGEIGYYPFPLVQHKMRGLYRKEYDSSLPRRKPVIKYGNVQNGTTRSIPNSMLKFHRRSVDRREWSCFSTRQPPIKAIYEVLFCWNLHIPDASFPRIAYTKMKGQSNRSLSIQRIASLAFSISIIITNSSSVAHGFHFQRVTRGVAKNSGFASRIALPATSQLIKSQFESSPESTDVVMAEIMASDGDDEAPSTMRDALRIFFLTDDFGPLLVIISILTFVEMRIQTSSLEMLDGLVFAATVIFWSFQEHFLHQKVLHSKVDWIGKDIHQSHHEKPFYHISIEPAPLLLGWLFLAHVLLRAILPLPLALTATVAYSSSGLFYVWAHFIVHTKVRFRSSFWRRVKENHMRHHMVSDQYWFAFSMPSMDDLFNTNPPVRQVKRQQNEEKRRDKKQQAS